MNAITLKGVINKKVAETNLTHQELYDMYFFEQFIEKISLSSYRSNLILKGGFLLENIVGIEERTTLDIDFAYQSKVLTQKEIEKIINEIIATKTETSVTFSFKKIIKINKEEKYEGYRVRINAQLDNLKKTFSLDIASGDHITPKPRQYEFKSNVVDQSFLVFAYNIETILAEKFETLIKREITNSRMKDFYDIHVLVNHQEFDADNFYNAFINTFEKRGTKYNQEFLLNVIEEIKRSKVMNDRYKTFTLNNKYAKATSFAMVMTSIEKLVGAIDFTSKTRLHPMKLIIIRHGEDSSELMGGWSNNELTKRGIKQVKSLAISLKDVLKDADVFITSDLLRAQQTAQILSDNLGVKFIVDERFRETNNGDLANLTKSDFLKKYSELFFANLDMNEKYPNGESPHEFYNRIKTAFLTLNEQYSDKKIVLVTHGGVFGVIKSIVNGVKWNNKQKYQIEYAETKEIDIYQKAEHDNL